MSFDHPLLKLVVKKKKLILCVKLAKE